MTDEITIDDLVNWYCEEQGIELWKDVTGFEGAYQVSNTGRVRSLDRYVSKGTRWGGVTNLFKKGGITSTKLNNHGYVQVHLYKDKKCSMFLIHRLVAMAFVPNQGNYSEVNHIDESKVNNNAANLEWCDGHYNKAYGTGIKRMGEKHRKGAVFQLTKDGEVIAKYDCIETAEKETGIHSGRISRCVLGKASIAGGYKWKREPLNDSHNS